MKERLKMTALGLILPLMMALCLFVPSFKVGAAESYNIDLEIEVKDLDKEAKDKDGKYQDVFLSPSQRVVKYYKLNKSLEDYKKIEIINDIYEKNIKETEEYLKAANLSDDTGKISKPSRFLVRGKDGKNKLVDFIFAKRLSEDFNPDDYKDFDKKNNGYDFPLEDRYKLSLDDIRELIQIENVSEGVYLLKETDDSVKKDKNYRLTPVIVEVKKDGKADIRVINKLKPSKEENTVELEKVDKENHSIKIEKVAFELYKKDESKENQSKKDLGVVVKEESSNKGVYTFSEFNQKGASKLITYSDGKIIVKNLPKGDYYFREIEPAKDYDKDKENNGKIFDVAIDKKVVAENYNPPTLKKTDGTDKKYLEGAVFKVFTEDDKELKFSKKNEKYYLDDKGIAEVVTDKKGNIFLADLKDGKYYFKETKAPKGYILEDKKLDFSIKNGLVDNKDGFVIAINKPEVVGNKDQKGGYRFIKTDNSKQAKRLGGAVFKVQKIVGGVYEDVIRDKKVYTVTSSSTGEFSVDNLDYGDYALRETKAPDGYIPSSEVIKFKVDGVSKLNSAIFIKNVPNENPTPPPTYNPPTNTTSYTPDVPKIIRGPLVKTGDIKIIIMAVVGLIMIILGIRLVRNSDKKIKAEIN